MSDTPVTATCTVCDTLIGWVDCPTGGWWAHLTHPSDHHDADPGSATMLDELLRRASVAGGAW